MSVDTYTKNFDEFTTNYANPETTLRDELNGFDVSSKRFDDDDDLIMELMERVILEAELGLSI